MTYLPFVDGLRAVAIAAVVAFHAFPELVPGGFAGVDVFFVISGFLITRFIAAEMQVGSFSLQRFFVRRARRLLPAAIVCFVVVTALAAVVLFPDALWYHGRSLMAAVLMYANFFFYDTGGYFSAPSLEKPLLHTWSLAVEDQFYLTWPLLLMVLMPRVTRKTLLVVVVAVLLASLAFAERYVPSDPEFAFFMLPARAWELLLGALVALAAFERVIDRGVAQVMAVLGMVAILASFAVLTPQSHFPGLGALPVCFGTAAVIVSSLAHPSLLTRALALKGVVFVGLISYSLYLWHWPLIALTTYWLERPMTAMEAGGVVVASVVAAVASWRFVEQPFRAGHGASLAVRSSTADMRFALSMLAGCVLVVSIALGLKFARGLPQRFDGAVRAMLDQMVSSNPKRRSCDNHENIFANDAICNFGRRKEASQSYELVLLGDSMADQWTSLVSAFAGESVLAGRQVTNGGCPFLIADQIAHKSSARQRECMSYVSEAVRFIHANRGLRVAVVAGYWEDWAKRLDQRPVQPAGQAAAGTQHVTHGPLGVSRFELVLSETLKMLTDRGIRVLLMGQVPVYEAIPVRCIASAIGEGANPDRCGKDCARGIEGVSRTDAILQRVAAANPMVDVFLPSALLCKGPTCRLTLDGIMIYRNATHINQKGAVAFAPYIRFPAIAAGRP